MKKVVNGKELMRKMSEAINLLCNSVKVTLGPKGSNVIIDHSTFSPFITNDGVTIAENIASDDEVVNTILELAKEASIKTNENVGDGTTTTLVILQSIMNNGLDLTSRGTNPMILKKELNSALKDVQRQIQNYSKIPSQEELKNIGYVAANDKTIGDNVSETYLKILNKDAINLKESDNYKTEIKYLNGYSIPANLASMYFLNNNKELVLQNVNILLINNYLNDLESIADTINKIIKEKANMLIIANNYNEYLIEEVVNINRENDTNIILLNAPLYGTKKMEILKDLEAISNSNIINNFSSTSLDNLGIVDNVVINNEEVIFNFKFTNNVKKRIIALNNSLNCDEEKEFVSKRLTMFEKGSAQILIGALTKTERREKKMRYEDALYAINEGAKGVLPGGGIILSKISNELEEKNYGYKLLKQAFLEPIKTILNNAGLNSSEILEKIKDNNYNVLYNINNDTYENIENTKILDATSVTLNAVSNAVSIASMLLTTTSIVINELPNNLEKRNEYNEI